MRFQSETSRSDMELLKAFRGFDYPYQIGPGVWDIHSSRVPEKADIRKMLTVAKELIPADRLWVNPDCGLKTGRWPEVEATIKHIVGAAKAMRDAG